jgi:hypothetical protein
VCYDLWQSIRNAAHRGRKTYFDVKRRKPLLHNGMYAATIQMNSKNMTYGGFVVGYYVHTIIVLIHMFSMTRYSPIISSMDPSHVSPPQF